MSKKILVCGAGGFIGGHLVQQLKKRGNFVLGVDIKYHQFKRTAADQFFILDLREAQHVQQLIKAYQFDQVYQLAADMGGAGFVFTGQNDAQIMHNSATINLNVLNAIRKWSKHTKVFYSSSACMYPQRNQLDPDNPNCRQDSAYPAAPDSQYGWQKLFSQRVYLAYARNYGIQVRIARFHNIFGQYGTWQGGRQKAPAAMCRKVVLRKQYDTIEVWGDGQQTRSFLHVSQCVQGVLRLMESDFTGPVNIGSQEMVTINQLIDYVAQIAGKKINKNHVDGPLGVRGRNSDNKLIKQKLGWRPETSLKDGLRITYYWILKEIDNGNYKGQDKK